MPVELNVSLDRRGLKQFGRLAEASRLMAAKALTFTAERAVPAWVRGHSVFHKRRTWIDRGVRKRPATPSNLVAKVGTIDKYMGRHVVGVGEEKRPEGGGLIFVPSKPVEQQGTHTQTRRQLDRMRGTKRKPFILEGRGGTLLLVRRKTKRRTPLEKLATLTSEIDIPERLDAEKIVEEVVHREFCPIYERLITQWAEKL